MHKPRYKEYWQKIDKRAGYGNRRRRGYWATRYQYLFQDAENVIKRFSGLATAKPDKALALAKKLREELAQLIQNYKTWLGRLQKKKGYKSLKAKLEYNIMTLDSLAKTVEPCRSAKTGQKPIAVQYLPVLRLKATGQLSICDLDSPYLPILIDQDLKVRNPETDLIDDYVYHPKYAHIAEGRAALDRHVNKGRIVLK